MATELPGKLILKGVLGSKAYGLDTPESDTDYKGVYVANTLDLVSLHRPPETVHAVGDTEDVDFHEVGKFIKLAMASNPTILEILFLDEYVVLTDEGKWIVNVNWMFPSTKGVANAYGGYATQQLKKLRHAHEELQRLRGGEGPERVWGESSAPGRHPKPVQGVQEEAAQCGLRSEPKEVSRHTEALAREGGLPSRGASSQQASEASPEVLRPDSRAVHGDGQGAERAMRDLSRAEALGGGSLSQGGPGSPVALQSVQPGAGAFSGRPGTPPTSDELREIGLGKISQKYSKYARHAFRLLQQGIELLSTGKITVRVSNREELFAYGAMPVEELTVEFEKHLKALDAAAERSVLPAAPDVEGINNRLRMIRMENI